MSLQFAGSCETLRRHPPCYFYAAFQLHAWTSRRWGRPTAVDRVIVIADLLNLRHNVLGDDPEPTLDDAEP